MSEARPTEAEADEQQHAVVPIPGSLRSEQPRESFWRRIRLRGARGRGDTALGAPTDDDRILARLDAIAAQLVATEQSMGGRIDELDAKFGEVWEVEETLSRLMELHDLVIEMRERQGRIDGRLRGLERRLSFIATLAGTAAAAAIAATIVALAS